MARSTFGGFGGDQVSLDPAVNAGFYKVAANIPATGTFWSASTGGTQWTDLVDAGTGVALAGVSTDAHGHVIPFKGPDGIVEGWVDFGGGRFKVTAVDSGIFAPASGSTVYLSQSGLDSASANLVNTIDTSTDLALRGAYSVKDHRTRLRAFYAALGRAKAAAGSCNILTIGDSISEGVGVTGTVENRWASLLRDQLRARHGGIVGGRGWVPCQYAFTTPDTQPWALSGGAAVSTNDYYGLGRRVSTLTAAGHTATLSISGATSIQLVTPGGPGFGTFSWKVDSGATTNVNCAGLGYSTPTEFTVDVPIPTTAAHTVTVTWVSGAVWLTGAMVYNLDEVNGLRLWDGGHSGAPSSYYTDYTMGWWTSVTRISPDLVILDLGVNDWATQPVTTTTANLGTTIDNIRAKVTNPPSILLLGNYARQTQAGDVDTWQNRVTAMRKLADQKNVAFLDLYRRLGSADTNTLGMFNADLIHPSNSGSHAIATAVMDYLENPIP